MKRFLLMLPLALLFLNLPAERTSSSKVQIDGIWYVLDTANMSAKVTCRGTYYYEYDEYQGAVTVPARILHNSTTFWVTNIEPAAFAGCKKLTSVSLPASIRIISKEAFKNCSSLQQVVLPQRLEVIQQEAFANCSKLPTIDFPSSLTTICDKAFAGCTQLKVVCSTAPNISTCAFENDCSIRKSQKPRTEELPEIIKPAMVNHSIVDTNIPETAGHNDNMLVVIIANEHYQETIDVPYAIHDGEIFYNYCIKTLGVPRENIRFIKDATYITIRRYMIWLSNTASSFGGNAKVILYYAGHGIPNEQTRDAYLLPTDGFGDDPESAYLLKDLYDNLGKLAATNIVVFLDACFSGATRDGQMLSQTRGIALKANDAEPKGNTVVFAATTGKQTAYPYSEQGHGMFTYFLLKKLQESKGNASLAEIVEYVQKNVDKMSLLINSKQQTPTIIPAAAVKTEWKKWSLK